MSEGADLVAHVVHVEAERQTLTKLERLIEEIESSV